MAIKRVEKRHQIEQAFNLDTLPDASFMHFDGSRFNARFCLEVKYDYS